MEPTDLVSEIKSWLNIVIKNENIDKFSVNIVGNSEKGDGYVGDIVFVTLSPIDGNEEKSYNLVLKISKRSKTLREQSPVKVEFLNEMYIYDKVLPTFAQFQLERGVEQPFDSVVKCYGTLETGDMEIIVLENLKSRGYALWDKREPLTRKHIELVLGEYAKFHGISIAMKDQKPEQFQQLTAGIQDVFKRYEETTDAVGFFENIIVEIADLLENELDEHILTRWRALKESVNSVLGETAGGGNSVILHGDCWSNNFLFKSAAGDELRPLKIALLDWQLSQYASPTMDLAYFIFATISEEDIEDLDTILRHYYESLRAFVRNLGSDLDALYSIEDFFADWSGSVKYGVIMGSMVYKLCSTDKEEVIDMADVADKGEDIMKAFDLDIKDKASFIRRSKPIVKYVVENNLI